MYPFQKIEKKWQKIWKKEKIHQPDLKRAKKPFYNLMMFPYPSAEGLHVGNMYAFTGSDIYGRYKRMRGYDVFEPIGLDGFGIHSENYALKIGVHPAKQAKISEGRFYKQLQSIGNGFAWDEHLETYDPKYYRWTQWIFIQLFKNGLAYRKKTLVNWCPSCKTVLADEQIIAGKCERCSNEILKKEQEQWFFRITKYVERLLKNLEKIDWSEKVKIVQKNWLGKSEGALIKFNVKCDKEKEKKDKESMLHVAFGHFAIEVFTTRPDTLFGATYLVLAPEHQLIKNLEFRIENLEEVKNYIEQAKNRSEQERLAEAGEKTGVELKGIKAINPANQEELSVWIADYVLASYGTGAIMAVPAHDERDFEFAKRFNLPIRKVIKLEEDTKEEVYEGNGIMINSGKFNGMASEKAKWKIMKFVGGKKTIQYHLRDWLISRQRYWGPPIPMIYCRECAAKNRGEQKEMPGWYAVPEKDLPVELPFVKDFRPTGKNESPLALVKSFYEIKCPKCGAKARRETDVSDTFLDSAWYYLAYLMKSENWKLKIESSSFQNLLKRWLPVDMYIGGAEHAVLHLLYSRFLAMVLKDLGFIHFEEPFTKFRAHGLLIKEGAKMSKSKGNIVAPDEYIKKFGADVFRMYLMFLAPFEQGGDFQETGILGIRRFLERVNNLISKISNPNNPNSIRMTRKKISNNLTDLNRLLHQTIKKITEDIENLHYNTAISALMILFNEFEKKSEEVALKDIQVFLKMLFPFAPHLSQELWQKTGGKGLLDKQSWPEWNEKFIQAEEFELVVQINGKLRDKFTVSREIGEKEASKLALNRSKIVQWLEGKKINKVIFVPGKLINIVIK